MRANTLCGIHAVVPDTAALDALMAEHGLRRALLERPGAVLPALHLAGFLEALAERLAIPDIGMRLARHKCAATATDPVDLAVLNAPTLEEAIRFGESHTAYYSPAVRFGIAPDDGKGDIRLHYRFGSGDGPAQQITEYGCLLACLNILGRADVRPVAIWLRHAPIAAPETYERHFRAPVRFAMPIDAIHVRREDFFRPIVNRDAALHARSRAIAERRQAQSKPLSAHLHAEIERLLPERRCSYDMVCETIGLSPRTMRRYLALENTTFKDLKDDVRRDTVRRALNDPDMRIADLAHHAGYYDPASIRRNIRRWGTNPWETSDDLLDRTAPRRSDLRGGRDRVDA